MANSDLICRLLLKTDDFNRNLGNAKSSVGSFEGNVKGMASKAGAAFGKLAGAVGLVTGGVEAFNKLMNSSQTLGDKYASTMETAKKSVDQFFYSLGSGEFNSFLTGMDEIIQKAQEAYAAMDQLGNAKISHGYISGKTNADIQEGQYYAKNKLAPMEQRMQGFDTWRNALLKQEGYNKNLQEDIKNAVITAVQSEIGSDNVKIEIDDIELGLGLDILDSKKRDSVKSQYALDYKEFQRRKEYLSGWGQQLDKNNNVVYNGKGDHYGTITPKQKDEELQKLSEQYKEAIVVNAMLNKYKDEELQSIASMLQERDGLTAAYKSMAREYNESAMEFNNSMKGEKGFKPVDSLEGYKVYVGNSSSNKSGGSKSRSKTDIASSMMSDSAAKIDEQIKELQRELANNAGEAATDVTTKTINLLKEKSKELKEFAQSPKELKSYVEELDNQIKSLQKNMAETAIGAARDATEKTIEGLIADKEELQEKLQITIISKGSIKEIEEQIKEMQKKFAEAASDAAREAAQKTLDELEKDKRFKELIAKNPLDKEPAKGEGFESAPTDLNSLKMPSLNMEGNKEQMMKEGEGINEVTDGLNKASEAMASLQGIADELDLGFLSSGFGMMGDIIGMIIQLQALTSAYGVTSAAKLPFPANLAAIYLVIRTVKGIFKDIKNFKFAEGGIVPGISFTGDKVPALLNSGEMVLNTGQQSNLFALANGKAIRGVNETREKYLHVDVGGKVNGKDIYLALNNYMKTSRSYLPSRV